ncbi:MAG TPA: hypothetical protein VKM72_24105 [Thermoanaerobaculia bacterium]|nr:hypothetical protein [Thermoanaerobaculia bacterium]
MCGRVVFRRTLFAVLLLAAPSCYDDDDGGGPTSPPAPVPRIAGIWSGIFASDDGEAVTIFDLVQNGRDVSGVVSVGAVAWPLDGTVDSRGFFRWRTGSGTCGSFDGTADLTSATHLRGRTDLDRFFCPERRRSRGDVNVDLENRR